jgi:hypothetical protein
VAATFMGEEEGTSVPEEDEERRSVSSCEDEDEHMFFPIFFDAFASPRRGLGRSSPFMETVSLSARRSEARRPEACGGLRATMADGALLVTCVPVHGREEARLVMHHASRNGTGQKIGGDVASREARKIR